MTSTLEDSDVREADEGTDPATPGLALVFSGDAPIWAVLPLVDGALEVGRDALAGQLEDRRMSRRHTRVFVRDGRLWAEDLDSRNGTSVDGRRLPPHTPRPIERCLRSGGTLLLPTDDAHRLVADGLVVQGGRVIGPHLRRVHRRIAHLARSSTTLHIAGESGVGKEDAARIFHAEGPHPRGPFVAVNSASIPESLAERLLFGARRGAFSGANADVDGYVQTADGGTLFLDELVELHAAVQAKLLRVLEQREVQALGAVRPTRVDIRVCSACHGSLRAEVAAGRLREDLYYRVGRPEVLVPPLRERREEIPWLVAGALQQSGTAMPVHFSFVEGCLLRAWPGNVRELLVEVRAAVQEALAEGSAQLEGRHLGAGAGQAIVGPPTAAPATMKPPLPLPEAPRADPSDRDVAAAAEVMERDELAETLRRTGGNVAGAARLLGVHRNVLRRLMVHHGLEPSEIPGIVAAHRTARGTRGRT